MSNVVTEYEAGKQEVLNLLFKRYQQLENEDCPDCDKTAEESEWRYCDVLCFQMNLITDVLRDCGYGIRNAGNEWVMEKQ